MVTTQDVIAAYRLLLGRLPESDRVVQNYVAQASFDMLRENILGSEEFASRVVAEPTILNLHPCILGSSSAMRLGSRQLEHLASLDLPLWGRSVLCSSIGTGLVPSFFVDRFCRVVVPLPARDCAAHKIKVLQDLRRSGMAGSLDVMPLDLDESADDEDVPTWQIVVSYDAALPPQRFHRLLTNLARSCTDVLALDMRVAFGRGDYLNVVKEGTNGSSVDVAVPTREWLWTWLDRHFAHVYVPRTQPCHEAYAVAWNGADQRDSFSRAIFIASRTPLANEKLSTVLLDEQEMHV